MLCNLLHFKMLDSSWITSNSIFVRWAIPYSFFWESRPKIYCNHRKSNSYYSWNCKNDITQPLTGSLAGSWCNQCLWKFYLSTKIWCTSLSVILFYQDFLSPHRIRQLENVLKSVSSFMKRNHMEKKPIWLGETACGKDQIFFWSLQDILHLVTTPISRIV